MGAGVPVVHLVCEVGLGPAMDYFLLVWDPDVPGPTLPGFLLCRVNTVGRCFLEARASGFLVLSDKLRPGSRVEMEFVNINQSVALLYDRFVQHADARTGDWLLMSSPIPQTIIIAAYVFFVTSWGPRLMMNQKAFDLRGVLIFYNFGVVALSLYMCYEFMMAGWGTGYTYRCDLVDYSPSGTRSLKSFKCCIYTAGVWLKMAATCWLYYFSKFIEMLDTVFFVLRKKNSQVTFLHVYHHSIMPFTWWFGVRFSAGGMGTFHAMLNSVVHVIMYTYYGLTALGPSYQKFLWWKKYLTSVQLVRRPPRFQVLAQLSRMALLSNDLSPVSPPQIQFMMVTTHISQYFFIADCHYQFPVFIYIIGLYGLIFLLLFLNFWYHAYTKGKRLPKVLQNQTWAHHSNGVMNGNANHNEKEE
ncbi:Elongation of very long chain fatty acids protein 7 [Merluccius polli]|uniref:Elongation of very long chain fatty acids protein n=1 Tax=Merluccius polli TaxID=89951 RepID=A0AA47MHU8_MERPO|nr:Elongation of very long chain fatty acids protein 7 [Merluccius polli]